MLPKSRDTAIKEIILALILTIASQEGLPPAFVQAIAIAENPALDPCAKNYNQNGTVDVGIMQLNSAYFSHIDCEHPETNIREACKHIKMLAQQPGVRTWWTVAIIYNSGIMRMNNPPASSIAYADKVMNLYTELSGGYVNPIIQRTKHGGFK